MTPGAFNGATSGYYKQMHFVAGRGTISDMLCPDRWFGLWEGDETVRKTYAVVRTS